MQAALDRLHDARRAVEDLALGTSAESRESKHVAEFSPLLWHLGHTAFIEAQWVLENLAKDDTLTRGLHQTFNALVVEKGKRADRHRALEWTLDYRRRVHAGVAEFLANPPSPTDALSERLLSGTTLVDFLAQHAYQHCETMRASLRLWHFSRAHQQHAQVQGIAQPLEPDGALPDWIELPATGFQCGATEHFAYDNEIPAFEASVAAFALGATPITNAQWLFHLEKSGERTQLPTGWIRTDVGWAEATVEGYRALLPDAPVMGVSADQADAFARARGQRLLSELEWECAARGAEARRYAWGNETPNHAHAFFAGSASAPGSVFAHPAGKSPDGVWCLHGNAWEWTATAFAPYPHFEPFPYPGYSQSWFDGKHRVLRGGSIATHGPLLRATMRNFYTSGVGEILATLRLARS
jgi:formylglycine-generating enzyme required for sulfatase activity